MVETDPAKKIVQWLDGYERGIYTLLEVESQILECITPQNAAEIYSTLPEEFQQFLKSKVESEPLSDAEWDTVEYVRITPGSYISGCGSTAKTPGEERAARQEAIAKHRLRIESLRELFRHRNS
ncbi:MAG: hypothetical protein ACIAZJ_22065 [Gimesia chilikensis]|uniref:hypothetical protein n=1 Tax=Gimesia chilikensis TaxID=2605989 RepID=UPI00378DFB21